MQGKSKRWKRQGRGFSGPTICCTPTSPHTFHISELEIAALDAMMHNSRAVGLRALSLATQKTPSRLRAPQLRSLQSSSEVPPAASQQSNRSLVTEQDAAKGLPKHTPDYTAMSDYRTS